MKNRMKKTIGSFLFLLMLAVALAAHAELSTNLRTVSEKDRWGKIVLSTSYVDRNGLLTEPDDKGYATVKYTYGTANVVVKEEYLDAAGNLVNTRDGYAYIKSKYNKRVLVQREWYDKDGNLVNGPEGYARMTRKYKSSLIRDTYYYDDQENVIEPHRIFEYNKYGKLLSDTWYDGEGNPAQGPDGYAQELREYDDRDEKSVAFYNADGTLYMNKKKGYAAVRREFDKRRLYATRYYDEQEQLIPGPEGYAYALYSYTPGSKVRTEMYYNADGSPFYTKQEYCGVSKLSATKGRVFEETYYVGDGVRKQKLDCHGALLRCGRSADDRS